MNEVQLSPLTVLLKISTNSLLVSYQVLSLYYRLLVIGIVGRFKRINLYIFGFIYIYGFI